MSTCNTLANVKARAAAITTAAEAKSFFDEVTRHMDPAEVTKITASPYLAKGDSFKTAAVKIAWRRFAEFSGVVYGSTRHEAVHHPA